MIQEIYLKKALNIRKEYTSIMLNMDEYDKFAKNLLIAIDEKTKDLQGLQNKIDEKKISSIEVAKDELMRILVNLESEANGIEKIVNGMNSRIDKLRYDETSLYKELKHKYPELSDSDFKKEIYEYISSKIRTPKDNLPK